MAKRCRQCGRPLSDNEGTFCSSGCRYKFEQQNPGVLARESKRADKLNRVFIVIGIIILILIYLFS